MITYISYNIVYFHNNNISYSNNKSIAKRVVDRAIGLCVYQLS